MRCSSLATPFKKKVSHGFFLERGALSLVPWHLFKSSLSGTFAFRFFLCRPIKSTTICTTPEKRRADVLRHGSCSLELDQGFGLPEKWSGESKDKTNPATCTVAVWKQLHSCNCCSASVHWNIGWPWNFCSIFWGPGCHLARKHLWLQQEPQWKSLVDSWADGHLPQPGTK